MKRLWHKTYKQKINQIHKKTNEIIKNNVIEEIDNNNNNGKRKRHSANPQIIKKYINIFEKFKD